VPDDRRIAGECLRGLACGADGGHLHMLDSRLPALRRI
jgi:hypothetical protein